MMVAVGALVLVNHLYSLVAPAARGGIRMAVIALATMWLADLALYTAAYLGGDWPQTLIAARGIVMAAIVPMLAIAVHRNGDWTLNISRTVDVAVADAGRADDLRDGDGAGDQRDRRRSAAAMRGWRRPRSCSDRPPRC